MGIWADSYQPASLNRVPFLVSSEVTQFGRRNDIAITPGSDLAQFVDLGRSIRPINFTAFFIGPSYSQERNAFIKVITKPGPYALIHPHYGPMFVVLNDRGMRATHTDTAGKKTALSLSFTEVSPTDFTKNLDTRIAVLGFALELNLALELTPPTLPSNSFSLLGKLQDLGLLMGIIEGKIASKLNVIESLTSAIQAFSDGIAGIAATPGQMMTRINELMTATFKLFETARDQQPDPVGDARASLDQVAVLDESMTELATFAVDELFIPPLAPSAVIEQSNDRGLSAGIRLSGLSAGCVQMVDTDLDSADQALALQTKIVELFDVAREENLSREVTKASRGLRGAISEHLRTIAATLPQITKYTPDTTLPAIVIAYRVHGDADRFGELVRRNRILHPNFVPPEPLEVKRDPPAV